MFLRALFIELLLHIPSIASRDNQGIIISCIISNRLHNIQLVSCRLNFKRASYQIPAICSIQLGHTTHGYPTHGHLLPTGQHAAKTSASADSGSQISGSGDTGGPISGSGEGCKTIEVTHSDANVMLHQRQFNFL